MIRIHPIFRALALAGLCACDQSASEVGAPDVSRFSHTAPPGAEPGTCWGKTTTPAIIETVTHQVLVQPEQVQEDGTVTQPAIYKTETKQDIVRERHDSWFQTPCMADLTPEFVASLQRALSIRGLYYGQITGEMDTKTKAAVRRFQKPQGLDSGVLSLDAARKIGLIAVNKTATG